MDHRFGVIYLSLNSVAVFLVFFLGWGGGGTTDLAPTPLKKEKGRKRMRKGERGKTKKLNEKKEKQLVEPGKGKVARPWRVGTVRG